MALSLSFIFHIKFRFYLYNNVCTHCVCIIYRAIQLQIQCNKYTRKCIKNIHHANITERRKHIQNSIHKHTQYEYIWNMSPVQCYVNDANIWIHITNVYTHTRTHTFSCPRINKVSETAMSVQRTAHTHDKKKPVKSRQLSRSCACIAYVAKRRGIPNGHVLLLSFCMRETHTPSHGILLACVRPFPFICYCWLVSSNCCVAGCFVIMLLVCAGVCRGCRVASAAVAHRAAAAAALCRLATNIAMCAVLLSVFACSSGLICALKLGLECWCGSWPRPQGRERPLVFMYILHSSPCDVLLQPLGVARQRGRPGRWPPTFVHCCCS